MPSEGPSFVPSPHPRQVRLLVVEDHRDTARMLWLLLAGSSYEVKSAADAAAALDLAAQGEFDLLISDIGLPDQTGYELMKEIRRRYGLKGIALTAYGMQEDIRKSREAGFSEHLVKPVELATLTKAIERVLALD